VPEGLLHAVDYAGESIPREAHQAGASGIDLLWLAHTLVGLDAPCQGSAGT
jgi:hypothetical protein